MTFLMQLSCTQQQPLRRGSLQPICLVLPQFPSSPEKRAHRSTDFHGCLSPACQQTAKMVWIMLQSLASRLLCACTHGSYDLILGLGFQVDWSH